MKRLICAVLILLMLIPSAFAAGEPAGMRVYLDGGSVSQLGDSVTVRLRVQNAPACEAMRFFFLYDDTVLEHVGDNQLSFNGLMIINADPLDDGRAKIGIAAASEGVAFEGDAELCEITFRMKSAPAQGAQVFTHHYHEFFDLSTGEKFEPESISIGTVTFTGSETPELKEVPNLMGMTKEEALTMLQNLKFKPICNEQDYTLGYAPNAVISQSIQPGTPLPEGSEITLTVNGMPQNVTVPNLVGKTEADAVQALQNLKLTIAEIISVPYDPAVEEGIVVGQSIPANSEILQGQSVQLQINGRPENTVAPSLSGKTLAEAATILTVSKLKYTTKTEPFNLQYAPGTVIAQSVAPGSSVLQGSDVVLTLNGHPLTLAVPDLRGKTRAEAEALVAEHQYRADVLIGSHNPNYAAGVVVGQSTIGPLLQGSTITLIINGEKPAMQNPFTDVKANAYYSDAVLWAVEKGITKGTTATTFSPNKPCSRGEIVTFLWRANGCPEPQSTVNPFKDVAGNAYYTKAVLWAVEKGITKGTSNTTFSPNRTCSRGEIVTFLWRANGSTAPQTTVNPFKDVAGNAFYTKAVLWAVEKGITKGTSNTTFAPVKNCSRGEIVTFLYRTLI